MAESNIMTQKTEKAGHSVRAPWWRGVRGEWYVAAQIVLIGLVFVGPRRLNAWPVWGAPYERIALYPGALLILAGGCLFLAGILKLGSRLTPLPHPKDNATLVKTGPYAIVRHPIYAGGTLLAFGWAFLVHGWLTLLYAAVLTVFLDIKSAREERWLVERYSDYLKYRKRVRKLIPFIR